ncbi:MAG TPA: hypothetical protein VGR57_10435, partial [Ktedonobacterales bacterium]|nr:hypothetical protein [Ktedonobacterales bacterium]
MLALVGAMGIGMVVLAGVVAFAIANPPDHRQHVWWENAAGILVVATMLSIGIAIVGLMVWLMTGERSILGNGRYTLDDWGLRRRGEARGQLSIAWHDVRAFYRVQQPYDLEANPRVEARLHASIITARNLEQREFAERVMGIWRWPRAITYVLDAGEQVLTWTLSFHERPASAATHEALFSAIVTRARIPLRDLTEQAVMTIRAGNAAERGEPVSVLPDHASADVALARLPRSRDVLSKRWTRALVVTPLVALLFVWGGGWSLQQIQRSMYGGLPARIHAHAPLFADSLTTDDGL